METTIKITPPEGYEFDKEKSTLEEIVFKKIENNFPNSWEELKEVKGYFIHQNSDINFHPIIDRAVAYNRNLFPTIEEAKAMLAMAQLCQLRDKWNEDWKPDWNNQDLKYVIEVNSNLLVAITVRYNSAPMFFKTREVRDNFMETFKDLLEVAKPFL